MNLDIIIQGGTIVDGTGHRPPVRGDVGIIGDRIAALGDLSTARAARAARVIDAHERVVSPGFIDVHVHAELALLGGPDQLAGARQGITTQLTSPDGFGWAPLPAEQADSLFRYTQFAYGDVDLPIDGGSVQDYLAVFPGHIPINVYPQVPHCAVRVKAMGWAPRPATDDELDGMVDAAREWMEAGAGALSIGLDYQPSAHADLRELVALSRLVAGYGGVYAAHIRKQALGRRKAWEETLDVARQANIPVHISHERVDGESADLLDRADREGIDVTFDSYLYPAGMTHLAIFLPLDVQAGSLEDMLCRMRDRDVRARSLPHLREELGTVGNQVIGYAKSGRSIGMTLAEAADAVGKSWEAFAYDLILEEEGIETWIIPWLTSDQESERIVRQTATHPRMMIASDGVYNIPHPHPRGYGCFARVLRRFVRQEGLLSLEKAVHKMSGLPAQRFGLSDRGRIAEGLAADLVVFDPATVTDGATWQAPRVPAAGVDWVLVNGVPVIQQGESTGQLPGRVVRRTD